MEEGRKRETRSGQPGAAWREGRSLEGDGEKARKFVCEKQAPKLRRGEGRETPPNPFNWAACCCDPAPFGADSQLALSHSLARSLSLFRRACSGGLVGLRELNGGNGKR